MQIIADLHTHTLSSTHAYQTMLEMAAAAKDLGYAALALTNHGPSMPDAPHSWHFGNQSALDRVVDGVAMLYGAEANVMDMDGNLDFTPGQLRGMDWVVASIHSPCVPGTLSRKEADRLWHGVAENPYVDCIGHSEQQHYRYDYRELTRLFAKHHKVVELNGNSFRVRRDGLPNMKALLTACMENGCSIAVNSDAHNSGQLSDGLSSVTGLLEELAFPQELIVNADAHTFVQELRLHQKSCAEEIGGILL